MDENISGIREQWNRFIRDIEPRRLDLFHYCLRLTGNPFDAEDLASDALTKTFVSRAFTDGGIDSPLAFCIRVASRLWIDENRRRERFQQLTADGDVETADTTAPSTAVEATELLYQELEPEQRAVLVLKELFGMSHKEIASTLGISIEKSRVTLHRSKKLLSNPLHRKPRVSRQLVGKFVDSFVAHDVDGLKRLMLDEVEATVFPLGHELSDKNELGWLNMAFKHAPSRLEIRNVLGESAILVFRQQDGDGVEALEEVWMLEESDGYISRITDYCACPGLLNWVAEYTEHPMRDGQFRFMS